MIKFISNQDPNLMYNNEYFPIMHVKDGLLKFVCIQTNKQGFVWAGRTVFITCYYF